MSHCSDMTVSKMSFQAAEFLVSSFSDFVSLLHGGSLFSGAGKMTEK